AATINRIPVLLLPGDVFASRGPDPVLQQLEVPWAGDVSVNDVFRPVSRYFDRILRPEQIVPAALAAMRVLTSSADTGAVTIGIGTRWTDFTTASKTAFQDRGVRFINLNVAEFDAHKQSGLALVGDARATIAALAGWSYAAPSSYREKVERLVREWSAEVERLYSLGHGPLPAQSEVIGAVNEAAGARDVVVCAAGSLPGDLHKLWRTRDA